MNCMDPPPSQAASSGRTVADSGRSILQMLLSARHQSDTSGSSQRSGGEGGYGGGGGAFPLQRGPRGQALWAALMRNNEALLHWFYEQVGSGRRLWESWDASLLPAENM